MFSNLPLPSFFGLVGFFWWFVLFCFNYFGFSAMSCACVFYKEEQTLSQALTHPSLKNQLPPFHSVAFSISRYFCSVLFTAFWCTCCTGTFKKQATEHKVKWRFICWKINIKKLTIYHLSWVSCIRLVLPTYSTTRIHDGHCWAPNF